MNINKFIKKHKKNLNKKKIYSKKKKNNNSGGINLLYFYDKIKTNRDSKKNVEYNKKIYNLENSLLEDTFNYENNKNQQLINFSKKNYNIIPNIEISNIITFDDINWPDPKPKIIKNYH